MTSVDGKNKFNFPDDDKKLSQKDLIAMKREARKAEDEKHLTFQPRIGAKPTPVTAGIGHGSVEPKTSNRFDKLYGDALKRQESAQTVADKFEGPSFTPQLVSRSSSRNKRAPSPLSVGERLYSASGAGKYLTVAPAVDVEATFKPQITRRASSVDRSMGVVTDRLYQQSRVHEEKLQRMRDSYTNKEAEQCTFAPLVRPATGARRSEQPSTGESPVFAVVDSTSAAAVAERLLEYENRRRSKLEEARRKQAEAEAAQATFKPAIVLTKRSATPSSLTIFERLSLQAQAQAQAAEKEREKERAAARRLSYCGSSKSLGSTGSVRSLSGAQQARVVERLAVSGSDRRLAQTALERMRAELELTGCTFKPQLPTGHTPAHSRSSTPSDRRPVHERLLAEATRQKEEAARREEARLAEELKGATFSPVLPARSASLRLRDSTASGTDEHGSKRDTIFSRLAAEAERIRDEQQQRALARTAEELKGATFAPTIPAHSHALSGHQKQSAAAIAPAKSDSPALTNVTAGAIMDNVDGSSVEASATAGASKKALQATPTFTPKKQNNAISTPQKSTPAVTKNSLKSSVDGTRRYIGTPKTSSGVTESATKPPRQAHTSISSSSPNHQSLRTPSAASQPTVKPRTGGLVQQSPSSSASGRQAISPEALSLRGGGRTSLATSAPLDASSAPFNAVSAPLDASSAPFSDQEDCDEEPAEPSLSFSTGGAGDGEADAYSQLDLEQVRRDIQNATAARRGSSGGE